MNEENAEQVEGSDNESPMIYEEDNEESCLVVEFAGAQNLDSSLSPDYIREVTE
jgi:hypothetical protein